MPCTLRIGWLRAAVLGANDGIVTTASLMVGVAAAAQALGQAVPWPLQYLRAAAAGSKGALNLCTRIPTR